MRAKDRDRLCAIGEALEVASIAMAHVVADSGAPDKHRAFVQKQWLQLAKLQVNFEEYLERSGEAPSPTGEKR